MRRTLYLSLLVLAPLPASANGRARVPVRANGLGGTSVVAPVTLQVTPLALLPAASLGAGPLLAAPQLAPAAAAALVPAGAVVTPPAAPVPVAGRSGIAPLAAPPAAQEGPQRLIDTLSVPMAQPDASAGSAESASASEADFMARAQLGGARSGSPATSLGALSAQPAPSGLLKSGPGGASSMLSPAKAQILPFAGVDHSGDVMKAALGRLESVPHGRSLTLDFAPSPKSLRVLGDLPYEVFLYRSRSDGRWRMARGDRHGVSGEWGDYDLAIHNHPEARLGAYSIQTDYPSPQDLETSRGKDARFMVVSKSGVVEWNSDVPEGIASKLESTRLGRLIMRITFPSLYPGHLARSGVALRATSWRKFSQDALENAAPPLNERILIETLIPRWVAAELPVVAQRLGRPLDDAHRADVLRRTTGYRMYWHSSMTYKDHPDNAGIPDGHFSPKFGIRLMVKPDWRRLPDLETHFRVLFAHEYTHWLQDEGVVSGRGDHEAEAVAVEMLRAIELVGLADVEAGRTGTIHANNLGHFATGREAVMKEWYESGLYVRGALGGAAYEVGLRAGRPEAAWEFLRIVTRPANQKANSMSLVVKARDAVLARR
jgi:hypothetical protein